MFNLNAYFGTASVLNAQAYPNGMSSGDRHNIYKGVHHLDSEFDHVITQSRMVSSAILDQSTLGRL